MVAGVEMTPDLRQALLTNKMARIGELAGVFLPAMALVMFAGPLVGENPLALQSVVLLANLMMLVTIWLGLRLRGQSFGHFGLQFRFSTWRGVVGALLQSLVVFVAALVAFLVGAVLMGIIVGRPEQADMSGYNYLRGNLPMLVLSLVAVYVSSSIGEEVIYRAFLINRLAELGSGSKSAWRLAVLISSVVFGLIHYQWGPGGMVQTGFMGLALGLSYLAVGRNLWIPILAHGYLDTILIVQMYFAGG